MKKLLLGLEVILITSIPILTIASCSSNAEELNLQISSKLADEIDVNVDELQVVPLSEETLDKIFNDINSDVYLNVTAKVQLVDGSSSVTIELTGINGYKINNEETFTSVEFFPKENPKNFKIKAKQASEISLVDKKELEEDKLSQSTLVKLFTNISQDVYENITASVEPQLDGQVIIKIAANEGYQINGEQELSSIAFTPIDTIDYDNISSKSVQEIEANVYENEVAEEKIIHETLDKIFNGINDEIHKNIVVEITRDINPTSKQIIVTIIANVGYTINGKKTLSAETFTPKPPAGNFVISSKISSEIIDITELDITASKLSLPTLSRIFDGIDQNVYQNIEASAIQDEITKQWSVIITANLGYAINNLQTYQSKSFNLNIHITKKDQIDKILRSELNDISLLTAQKLFDNIDNNNFANMSIIYDSTPQNTLIIKPSKGYMISNQDEHSSNPFDITLEAITPKGSIEMNMSDVKEDIIDFNKIKLIFDGLIGNNLQDNFIDRATYDPENRTIVLHAQNGYVFNNGQDELSSEPLTINLAVTQINSPEAINDIELDGPINLKTVLKLFNIESSDKIPQEEFNNIQVTFNNTLDQNIVTLEASNGYKLNGNGIIKSVPFNVIITKIVSKSDVVLTFDEVNTPDNLSFATVNKVFTGLIDSELSKNYILKATYDPINRIITLTAQPGFLFPDLTNKLISGPITINSIIESKSTSEIKDVNITDLGQDKLSEITLGKIFNGINPNVYSKISTKVVRISDSQRQVTLIIESGYTINGASTFTSEILEIQLIRLKITAKPDPKLEIQDVRESNITSMVILQSVFDFGITSIEAKISEHHIKSAIYNLNDRMITLSAEDGYTFNDNITLVSAPIIINFDNISPILLGDILFTSDELDNGKITIELISQLFNGFASITSDELQNIELISRLDAGNYIVDISPKEGYQFNHKDLLISSSLFKIIINNITPKKEPIVNISELQDINNISFETIEKVFEGLSGNDFSSSYLLKATYDPKTRKITLITKDGFKFNNGTLTLESKLITQLINTPTLSISQDDLNSNTATSFLDLLNANNIDIHEKLNLLFDVNLPGTFLSNENVSSIVSTIEDEIINVSITLRTNYTFESNQQSINLKILSNIFQANEIQVPIKENFDQNIFKNPREIFREEFGSKQDDLQQELDLLFGDGLSSTGLNINNVDSIEIPQPNKRNSILELNIIITLKGNNFFNDGTKVRTIVIGDFKSPIIDGISQIQSPIITMDEYTQLQQEAKNLIILDKIFTGLNDENLENIKTVELIVDDTEVDYISFKISLETNEHYFFEEYKTNITSSDIRIVLKKPELSIDSQILKTNTMKTFNLLLNSLPDVQQKLELLFSSSQSFTNLSNKVLNIASTIDIDNLNVTITLKSGYVFEGNSLDENIVLSIELAKFEGVEIKKPTSNDLDQNIFKSYNREEFKTHFESLGNDLQKELELIFKDKLESTGLTSANVKSIDIDYDASELNKLKITIKLEEGFFFDLASEMTLTTINFPNGIIRGITLIDNPIITLLEEGEALKPENPFISFETLKKVFGGLNGSDLAANNLLGVTYSKSGHIVTLTANNGYIFENVNTSILQSKEILIDLDITLKTTDEIKDVTDEELMEPKLSIETLQKIFTGINSKNSLYFTSSVMPTLTPNQVIVTLSTIPRYSINGQPTLASNEFLVLINLDIISKSADQIELLNVTDEELNAPTLTKETLKKIFDGITDENYSKFTVSVNGGLIGRTKFVTLTANDDHHFSGKTNLDSNEFSVKVNLSIIPKKIDQIWNINITDKELEELSIATLQKLFDGIDEKNYLNITIEIKDGSTPNKKIVTLAAKEGYSINGKSTLDSYEFSVLINLDITSKQASEIQDVTIEELKVLSIKTLQKIFTGIDEKNYLNFTASAQYTLTPNQATVTLIAKEGYSINGKLTLNSYEFSVLINLDITSKQASKIQDVTDEELNVPMLSIETLQKLFDGIDEKNYLNITIEIKDGSTPNKKIVTLAAKEGYSINGQLSLDSNEFLENINLNITSKSADDIQALNVTEQEVTAEILTIETLQKIFDGIDETNYHHFTATRKFGSTLSQTIITLTAIDGYLIQGQRILESNEFQVKVNFNITSKSLAEIQALNVTDEELMEPKLSIETLQKIFNGITEANYKNIISIVKPGSSSNERKVTLTVSNNYIINGHQSLDSASFSFIIVTNLNITTKTTDEIGNIVRAELSTLSLSTLQKIFNNLDQHKYDRITAWVQPGINPGEFIIVLRANFSYTINGEEILESASFTLKETLINYEITLKSAFEIVNVTNKELEKSTLSFETLQKIFDGITAENYNNIIGIGRLSLSPTQAIVTLTAKNGYSINDQDSLESNRFSIIIDYNIEKKTSAEIKHVTKEDLRVMSLETLQKIFIGINLSNYDDIIASFKYFSDQKKQVSITLTAKSGYSINGQPTFVSSWFLISPTIVDLDISTKSVIEIGSVTHEELKEEKLSLTTLNKIFDRIFSENYKFVNSSVQFFLNSNEAIITLTAKTNYTINGVKTLQSNKFTFTTSQSGQQDLIANQQRSFFNLFRRPKK